MKNIEDVLSTIEGIVEYIKHNDSTINSYKLRIEELEKEIIEQREINKGLSNKINSDKDVIQNEASESDVFNLSMLPQRYHLTVRLNAHLHNYSRKTLDSVEFKNALSSDVKRYHFHKISSILKEKSKSSSNEYKAVENTTISPEVDNLTPLSSNITEISGKQLNSKFDLTILPGKLHEVIEKTKHIHKYNKDLLNIKEAKLRLWLNQAEINSFRKAKQLIIFSESSEVEEGASVVKSNGIVNNFSRLIDIDVPEHLVAVKSKVLITLGNNVTIAGIKQISTAERAKLGPIAVSFIALQSHLKKRVRNKTLEVINTVPSVYKSEISNSDHNLNNSSVESYHSEIIGGSITFEPTVLLENDLFQVKDGVELKVDINLKHTLFENIDWFTENHEKKFIMEFLALWASMRKDTNSDIASSKLKTARAVLGKSLHQLYHEGTEANVNLDSLPATMLMDFKQFNGTTLVTLNVKHPFYEVLLSDIEEEKRENIYKFIFAWAIAEKETLSKNIHEALIFSREHLSTYSYDKFDEYLHEKLV
ncbi:hypothetical protein BCU00_002215 [Vibrio breoganii]|uniref:hypothetical protein n=1 Tax=Vibrio breoganii TaxID=553239 RepID=UPI000C82AE61|nr:hypothetical protein [Vibrio breoganii]PMK41596.1 hypothetical protein BCU00_13975 [Vibrio breoganii]